MKRKSLSVGGLMLGAVLLLGGCAEKTTSSTSLLDPAAAPAASGQTASGQAAAVTPSGPSTNALTIRQELQQVAAALVAAKNTRNVESILACYDPDARVMTWIDAQRRDVLTPMTAYKDMLPAKVQGWTEADRRHTLVTVDEPVLRGNEVVLSYRVRIEEGHPPDMGEVLAVFTARLTKRDGRWVVVEERYAKAQ